MFVLDGSHFAGKCIFIEKCSNCDKPTSEKRKISIYKHLSYVTVGLIHSPGTLVPNATKTIAVTESLIPKVHPKCEATSPIIAVTTPIANIDTTKQT